MTSEKREDRLGPVPAGDELFDRVVVILERARERVVRSVNSEMVIAYWHVGREIVEHLQAGRERAAYGRRLLKHLSERLETRCGRGFSVTNLRYFRLFYQAYSDRNPEIRHEPGDESTPGDESDRKHHKACDDSQDQDSVADPSVPLRGFSSGLSWSHYRALTRVGHRAERLFYEIEAENSPSMALGVTCSAKRIRSLRPKTQCGSIPPGDRRADLLAPFLQ